MSEPQPQGYTLIEPVPVSSMAAQPECNEITICILSWLANEMERRSGGVPAFEVIPAEYYGKYPCLAALGALPENSAETFEKEAMDLLRGRSILDLIEFAASQPRWRRLACQLLKGEEKE